MPETPRSSLFRKITGSVPLLISVILHAIIIALVGYFVVTETIIGKKKKFEATPPADTASQKQLEHRLQIARKSGGAAPVSPVNPQRIFANSKDALQMPELSELPQVGKSALGGGFGAGAGMAGAGTGYGTGLGNSNVNGAGFMSMSFLGATSARAKKVVFVVDVGLRLLDIKKGGFEAFAIIRDQMMRLVSNLPPSAEFGVVLFDSGGDDWLKTEQSTGDTIIRASLFRTTLLPATVNNKTTFTDWMRPINANPTNFGMASIKDVTSWKRTVPPNSGLKPDYRPTAWVNAVHAALELKPDTVFVIAGVTSLGTFPTDPAEIAKREKEHERSVAEYKKLGFDLEEVGKARRAALDKARAELDAINAKRIAQGKPPFIITRNQRIVDKDFQTELKKNGTPIVVDGKGWTLKDGKYIWAVFGADNIHKWEPGTVQDMQSHISRLQAALLKDRATLNIFLFVGPDEKRENDADALARIARANGGRFELLTTKRLQEIKARTDEEDKK